MGKPKESGAKGKGKSGAKGKGKQAAAGGDENAASKGKGKSGKAADGLGTCTYVKVKVPQTASNRRKNTWKAKDGSICSKVDSKEDDEGMQSESSESESDSKQDEEGVKSGSSESESDSKQDDEGVKSGSSESNSKEQNVEEHDGGQEEGTNQSVKRKRKRGNTGKHQHMDLGPIPGGPKDETLLKSFREHIAYAICKGDKNGARKPLRLHVHYGTLRKWVLKEEVQKVKDKLAMSGLLQFIEGCFKVVDPVLISAMIERWHRETNTFHLPFGEMTITLDDVHQILGIPVVGTPIYVDAKSFTVDRAADLLVTGLGVTKEDALKELKGSLHVKMSWIREKCAGLVRGDASECQSEDDRERKVDYVVRGYLMYAFGCTVFPDSSGTKVSVMFLEHLQKVDEINTYSWGTAVLAYLFKWMGVGSKAISKGVGGCLTLLQVWTHEHLRIGNGVMYPKYDESLPRMHKWIPRSSGGDKVYSLISLREQLDDITEWQVVWDPYKDYREQHPFPLIAWFKGWLVCQNIEEPIYPDRVQRQLGMQQHIPDLPIRVFDDNQPKVDYLLYWEDHIIPEDSRGKKAIDDWDCSPHYVDWYQSITHRIVQNPQEKVYDTRQSGQRSRTLLEEIQGCIDIARKPPIRSDLLVSLGRIYMEAKCMIETPQWKAGERDEVEDEDESEDDPRIASQSATATQKSKRGKIVDPVIAVAKKKNIPSTSSIVTRQTRQKLIQPRQTSKKPSQNSQTIKNPSRK